MDSNLYFFSAQKQEFDINEILRYCHSDRSENIIKAVKECIEEATGIFNFKAVYKIVPVSVNGITTDMGFANIRSASFAEYISDCTHAVVLAATSGIGTDRLINRYKNISPLKALIYQAIGTQQTEAFCDMLCTEISKAYYLKTRFSPGYGDLNLNVQKDIFKLLNCEKNIYASLNDSCVISPTKTITAFAGIKGEINEIS